MCTATCKELWMSGCRLRLLGTPSLTCPRVDKHGHVCTHSTDQGQLLLQRLTVSILCLRGCAWDLAPGRHLACFHSENGEAFLCFPFAMGACMLEGKLPSRIFAGAFCSKLLKSLCIYVNRSYSQLRRE
jgi:hypothetical protein